MLFSAALFPMWFLSSLYLQQVLGLSPLDAGLCFLPMALTIMVVARSAGGLVSRFGVRAVLGSGLTMMTIGLLLFTRIAASGSPIVYVVVPGILTAAGIGFSIVPSTIAATQGAKQGQAGLASGLVNTSRQVGGGLGLALLITLATQYTTQQIGQGHGVPQALTDGFRLGYIIAAAFTAVALVVTLIAVPRMAVKGEPVRRVPAIIALGLVIAAFLGVEIATAGNHGAPIGAYVKDNTDVFVTQPNLHPPIVRTGNVATSRLAPGYIFMTSFYDLTQPPMTGQSGPLILDNHAQPVWFHPVPEDMVAANLSRQIYHGQPAIAWWQGNITSAGQTLSGEDVIVDKHYHTIATLKGKDGWILTLHELVVDGNHAWVTANKNVPLDLSKYGGAYNGVVIDSAVQEYDINTGKLLFTWDALKHVSPSDSEASLPTNGFPWDAYHVNSIQVLGNGTFLASMRNTWAAYLVNAKTGAIEWTMGGRHSSYTFNQGAGFQWQHDVGLHPGNIVTMFDDHCCQITGGGTYVSPTGPSRGLVIKLNPQSPPGQPGHSVRPRELRRRIHGQHPAPAQRQRDGRMGFPALPLRVQPFRPTPPRRRAAPPRPELPRHTPALGRQAALPACRRGPQGGGQDSRVRELERRHPGPRVEGPGQQRKRPHAARGRGSAQRLRDLDRCAGRVHHVQGRGPERPRPGDRDDRGYQVAGAVAFSPDRRTALGTACREGVGGVPTRAAQQRKRCSATVRAVAT